MVWIDSFTAGAVDIFGADIDQSFFLGTRSTLTTNNIVGTSVA